MFIDTKARCFMEAAKCLNFTRAAEKLYISQPALSKNIASLEDQCGMKPVSYTHLWLCGGAGRRRRI